MEESILFILVGSAFIISGVIQYSMSFLVKDE
jgi:hypothetical protein